MTKIFDCPVCKQPSPFVLRVAKESTFFAAHNVTIVLAILTPSKHMKNEEYGPEYFQKHWFQNENTQ
jgi:hypothetical protein